MHSAPALNGNDSTRERSACFAPISGPSARVLILGSLPGIRSLERQQYYAHPHNLFWKIMGALVGAAPELPYAERGLALIRSGIALWDVCASAHRTGSLDSAIQNHAANEFTMFFAAHPRIDLVCFNGQKAAVIYRRSVLGNLTPPLRLMPTRVLPSTSAANASISYAEKLRQWSLILANCRAR